jgi:hypothetical protein
MKKQIVILLFLHFFFSFPLCADIVSDGADEKSDMVYVINDSLIRQELKHNLPGRLLRMSATVASIPVSSKNAMTLGFNFLLFMPSAPIVVGTAVSYFLSYPFFVNMSIRGIQKRNIKERLIREYSEKGQVVDHSSISLKRRPAWSAYGGLTYSTFFTNNVTPYIKHSWGIKYDYPINRFIGISHRVQCTWVKADLKGKKFLKADLGYESKQIVDIHFEAMSYYVPLYLTLTIPMKKDHKIYGSLGTGMARIQRSNNQVKTQYGAEFEEEDYGFMELPLNFSNPMYTGIIGYSNRYGFAEIMVTRDYNFNSIYREVSYIFFDERMQIFEVICGMYLDWKF